MPDRDVRCVYFQTPGATNTDRTLALARERAAELDIRRVLVASTSGKTGVQALMALQGHELVVVSHSTGFAALNEQQLEPEHRATLEAGGAHILTCQHAFGGLGRAVRRKFGTYQLEEIIAFALRSFCEGVKAACEITLMAADAGWVNAGEEIIAIAGTGHGADTAVVLRAANAQDFFDLRVLEIICKPRLGGAE